MWRGGCVNITRAGRGGRSRKRRGWTHPFLSSFSNARRRSSASFFFAKRSCASGGGGREVKPLTAARVSFGARDARRGHRGRRRARRGARRTLAATESVAIFARVPVRARARRRSARDPRKTLCFRVALGGNANGSAPFDALTSGREGSAGDEKSNAPRAQRVARRPPAGSGRARPGRDRLPRSSSPSASGRAMSDGCARDRDAVLAREPGISPATLPLAPLRASVPTRGVRASRSP